MGNFQKLRVWQLAKNLAVKIYKLTKSQKYSKDFGLKDQIQRAAVSVPANISEGDELGSNRQSIKHFNIAKGSVAEVQTLLITIVPLYLCTFVPLYLCTFVPLYHSCSPDTYKNISFYPISYCLSNA
jgi:four helix bundle protein